MPRLKQTRFDFSRRLRSMINTKELEFATLLEIEKSLQDNSDLLDKNRQLFLREKEIDTALREIRQLCIKTPPASDPLQIKIVAIIDHLLAVKLINLIH